MLVMTPLAPESILVTGGTGSFGKAFIHHALKTWPELKRLVIFSRDELKQWDLQQKYPQQNYPNLRFMIGDIRDKERLRRAMEGIEVVVHAAALKQVPTAEYNPFEFIKTNVIGSNNLIECCIDQNVKRIVALSTDKAAAPINLYGATKLCADKLFIAANKIVGSRKTRFSVVRYGNVMMSRGSVIPFFYECAKTGSLPITHREMTRFNISLDHGVKIVHWAIENCVGGELIVPKIPSYKVVDVAQAVAPNCKLREVGTRPGEKLHEEMITKSDAPMTIDIGDYYIILPPDPKLWDHYENMYHGTVHRVPNEFSYNSGTNERFLSVEELRNLIAEEVKVRG